MGSLMVFRISDFIVPNIDIHTYEYLFRFIQVSI